jgi:hypothetical protein
VRCSMSHHDKSILREHNPNPLELYSLDVFVWPVGPARPVSHSKTAQDTVRVRKRGRTFSFGAIRDRPTFLQDRCAGNLQDGQGLEPVAPAKR